MCYCVIVPASDKECGDFVRRKVQKGVEVSCSIDYVDNEHTQFRVDNAFELARQGLDVPEYVRLANHSVNCTCDHASGRDPPILHDHHDEPKKKDWEFI
jgi:hypothetical protein